MFRQAKIEHFDRTGFCDHDVARFEVAMAIPASCAAGYYDLIVSMDDATSEIYYAQLVEEESILTVTAGLREVIAAESSLIRTGGSMRLFETQVADPYSAKPS